MFLIRNGLVFDEKNGFVKKDILIDGNIVARIEERINEPSGAVVEADGCYVVPGFIDIHTHGANGIEAMSASYRELDNMSRFFASKGVTGFLPTTMTAPVVKIVKALESAKEAIREGTSGAKILGVHLEGPFINKKYKGAQGEEYIMHPSIELVKSFINKSGGTIRVITLAPELEGVKELVKYFGDGSVVFAIGHSAINAKEAFEAFSVGIRHVTHLFNAMMGIHHREPGLAGAAIDDEDVTVEIIADGIHVCPEVIRMVVKCKGVDKIALVTDSSMAAGLEDGEYVLGEQKIVVQNKVARLLNGVLAGSTLTMADAVRNMVKEVGVSLKDAVKMASTVPARIIRVDDRKGSISPGKDADIVLLDKDINVRMTFVEGKPVYNTLDGSIANGR